jgi:hypothetical protein
MSVNQMIVNTNANTNINKNNKNNILNTITVGESLNMNNKMKNTKVVEMLIDEHAPPKQYSVICEEVKPYIEKITNDELKKQMMLSDICYRHLNLIQPNMDNLVFSVDDCLIQATDSAINLVEQLHNFMPWYVLIRQLDDIQEKLKNMNIDGINFIKLQDNNIKKSRMEVCASVGPVGPVGPVNITSFPKTIYDSIFEMFKNFKKYDTRSVQCQMTQNDMLQRNVEIEQSYNVEEGKLYNCINDFNQKMSQYLLTDNKEKLKTCFMKAIKC